MNATAPAATDYYYRMLDKKLYELTDHLGNVRAVVIDEKLVSQIIQAGIRWYKK